MYKYMIPNSFRLSVMSDEWKISRENDWMNNEHMTIVGFRSFQSLDPSPYQTPSASAIVSYAARR